MRSIAEIDRDHEGMGRACVRANHGCNYPACECDRSKRIVPNVRGIGGPGPGDTCVHNDDERHCRLCQRHAQQLAHGVTGRTNWRAVVGEPAPVIPPANPDLQPGGKHDPGVTAAPAPLPLPEFEKVSYGVDSVMRPVEGMAISEYAFRQWAKDVGITLAAGVKESDHG